jgi:hypothetical protein
MTEKQIVNGLMLKIEFWCLFLDLGSSVLGSWILVLQKIRCALLRILSGVTSVTS